MVAAQTVLGGYTSALIFTLRLLTLDLDLTLTLNLDFLASYWKMFRALSLKLSAQLGCQAHPSPVQKTSLMPDLWLPSLPSSLLLTSCFPRVEAVLSTSFLSGLLLKSQWQNYSAPLDPTWCVSDGGDAVQSPYPLKADVDATADSWYPSCPITEGCRCYAWLGKEKDGHLPVEAGVGRQGEDEKPNSTLAKWWLQTTGSLEVESHGAELTKGFVEAEGWHDVHVLSLVWLFVTPWTGAHQAPLSLGSSGQECWRGLLCPPPGDLPDPAIEPASLMSPALADEFFTTSAIWEARTKHRGGNKNCCWPLTQDSQKGL